MSQAKLLGQRRFWPFFLVSFLGAFNDNLFKNALVMLVTFGGLSVAGVDPGLLVPMSTGLIILPFVLFSATSGQLSDRYAKSQVIRWVKQAEVPIMALGAVGMVLQNTPLLLTVLFLTGLQSTVFSPTKYSYLPEVLPEDDLVGGNALIEMGTFLAILLGTIAGGALITSGVSQEVAPDGTPTTAIDPAVLWALGGSAILVALMGVGTAMLVPKTRPANPTLKVSLNPIPTTLEIARETVANRSVFWSVIGISWFWFLGAAFLALMPGLGEEVLKASPAVVTWFLALFCVGIGVGSLLVEKLGEGHLELGLVPIGALGMTLFAADVYFASEMLGSETTRIGLGAFLGTVTGVRLSVDLLLLAACGGFFTVPLYTLMQTRSPDDTRSRIVAGCNLLNAIFMVVSAGLTTALLAVEVSIPTIFLILSGLNTVAIAIICWVIPEFILRMIIWVMVHTVYRLTITHTDRVPPRGRAVMVSNHPSFIDFMFLVSASRRPMRFVVWHTFYHRPSMNWLFRAGNA
ncbi:MAG: MFS transporter, partial [Myxococcota bacterium]